MTAFETLKPKVMEAETIVKYQSSASFKSVESIESYLNHFNKTSEKTTATADLIISFVLSEKGERLAKNLSVQRKQLRSDFSDEALPTLAEKRKFLARLANLSVFTKEIWHCTDLTTASILDSNLDNETGLALAFLQSLKHTIVIAPLSRFYQIAVDASDPTDKAQAINDLMGAIKACTAFSALWADP